MNSDQFSEPFTKGPNKFPDAIGAQINCSYCRELVWVGGV